MKEIRGYIRADSDNRLLVEEVSCTDLAQTYGTPLFAISENTLRAAYRKFRDAFQSRYEANVIVCVGMKSNYGLAVRKIIAQEGGGGDAFGLGELYVALLAGTDPKKIVMNSPNKDEIVLRAAIENGIMINVDNLAEIEIISQIARTLGKTADVCHRIRVPLYQLEGIMHIDPRYGPPGTDIAKWEREFKFGMEPDALRQAVEITITMPEINTRGIMYHGGIPRRAGYSREELAEIMDYLGEIYRQVKWQPEIIDLGGGFVPSRYGMDEQTPIETYAEQITSTLKAKCQEHGMRLPDLILEPGR